MAEASPVRYAHNGDLSIAYRVAGSGPIDLLFISGFVSHLDIARTSPVAMRFWDRLSSFARVIWFDKRGQGLSDPGEYTLEGVASDAVAVLDAVGIERVSVFGVSEGGSASTMLAATRPDRVEAMAQYGTYARISRAPDYPQGIPPERIDQTWNRILETWGDAASLALFAPSMAGDSELGDWMASMTRSGASPATAHTISQMYAEADVRPLLGMVKVPTLVLFRKDDKLVPPALSRTVAEGIPGARAIELDGGDHLFIAGDQTAMLDEVEEFLTGRPPALAGERALATVLFIDIVDSTARAARLGDRAWRDLLERSDRAWRREIGRQRGTVVKSTGDGVLATFDGPTQGARAALAIRDYGGKTDLPTRAGLHTGECELLGEDIGGIAVHIASRVEGLAPPGGVMATGTVRDLSIGSGLIFEERGSRTLKGVPGEWPVFAVEDSVAARPARLD